MSPIPSPHFNECKTLAQLEEFVNKSILTKSKFILWAGRKVSANNEMVSLGATVKKTEQLYMIETSSDNAKQHIRMIINKIKNLTPGAESDSANLSFAKKFLITPTNKTNDDIAKKNNEYNHYLAAVKNNGYALKGVPETIDGYKYICIVAVTQNSYMLKSLPDTMNSYNEICLAAVKKNGLALQFVEDTVDGYIYICIAAVEQDSYALQFVKDTMDEDIYMYICIVAVKQDGYALRFVPDTTKGYNKICLNAVVQEDGYALRFVPDTTKGYNEICVSTTDQ